MRKKRLKCIQKYLLIQKLDNFGLIVLDEFDQIRF